MQETNLTPAYVTSDLLEELPEAVDYSAGTARQRGLRSQLRSLPRRFDLLSLVATTAEILLWLIVLVMEVPMYFTDFYTLDMGPAPRLLHSGLLNAAGLLAFMAAGYGSLFAYRLGLGRALSRSDLNLQFASGMLEEGDRRPAQDSAETGETIEHLLAAIARRPRRFTGFRTFFFSPGWFVLYYSLASAWAVWSMLTINESVMTLTRAPHLAVLELSMPLILLGHLRKVRLREVCDYLDRMLRR